MPTSQITRLKHLLQTLRPKIRRSLHALSLFEPLSPPHNCQQRTEFSLEFCYCRHVSIRKTIIKVATCLAAVVGCPRAAKHHSAPSFTGNILVFVESVVELVNQDEEGAWNAPYLCYIPRFERSITTISLNQTLTENMNDNHPIPMCERLGCNGGWSASAKPKTLRIQVDWDNKCGGFEFAELAEAKADLTASHEYMVECFVALITEKTRQLFEPTN